MTKEKKIFQQLTSRDVCQIYELLLEHNLVSFKLTKDAENKIDSSVASITGVYYGYESYKSLEEKAVAYFYFIIKNHPFIDGNKRTGTLAFMVLCRMNNLSPDFTTYPLDTIAIFIEKIQEKDHQKVIRTLAELLFEKKSE